MSPPVWHLSNNRASLNAGALSATVDVAQPALGLRDVSLLPADSALFQVRRTDASQPVEESVADSYVRQNDLIATYGQQGQLPFSTQIYWRSLAAVPDHAIQAAVDVIVSTQTDLLDSRSVVTTHSRLPAAEILHLCESKTPRFDSISHGVHEVVLTPASGTGCLVFRLADKHLSYIEMVHPVDFTETRLITSAGDQICTLRRTAVDHWMEKGVIVRARLRGVFTDRDADLAAAVAAYEDFCTADIPLTT